MAYQRSGPLLTWSGSRRAAIRTLQTAHAVAGEVDGPGRPREIGRPLAHAYVLRVVTEFQAFARDLHDLAALRVTRLSGAHPQYESLLVASMTDGRRIDRGNADLASLAADFRRLGIRRLSSRLDALDAHWSPSGRRRKGDRTYYGSLIRLRNCLAHGNQTQLDALRTEGVLDTVSWARGRLPGLDRIAEALDRVVWEHLVTNFGVEPW